MFITVFEHVTHGPGFNRSNNYTICSNSDDVDEITSSLHISFLVLK